MGNLQRSAGTRVKGANGDGYRAPAGAKARTTSTQKCQGDFAVTAIRAALTITPARPERPDHRLQRQGHHYRLNGPHAGPVE